MQVRTCTIDTDDLSLRAIGDLVDEQLNEFLAALVEEGKEVVNLQVLPARAKFTTYGSAEQGDPDRDYGHVEHGFLAIATIR